MDGDALGTKLFIAKSSDSASDLELPFRTQCGSPEWENGRCRIFRADARYTGKSYFRAYAEELLDEVFDMVHENVPIDFDMGFAVSVGESNTCFVIRLWMGMPMKYSKTLIKKSLNGILFM